MLYTNFVATGSVAILVASFCTSAFAQDHSRYLPSPDDSIVTEYGLATATQYDRQVMDSVKGINAGMIRFDYNTISHDPGDEYGGAALAGGFFMNPGVVPKPCGQLHWVQIVDAKATGSLAIQNWKLPENNAGWYPDAPPLNRVYPHESLPDLATPPVPPPTLPFQDAPGRKFIAGFQESWRAELGLVWIADHPDADEFTEVRVIGTFVWGFKIWDPDLPFGVDDVTANHPVGWGPPSALYLSTLNQFYDGAGGGGGDTGLGGVFPPVASKKYRFTNNSNAFSELPMTGRSVCEGDGVTANCPCNRIGLNGGGCPNSAGPGAKLVATGKADTTNDTFTLTTTGLPNTVGLYFQGTVGLEGVPLGEGLLCLIPTKRHGVQFAAGGQVVKNNLAGDAAPGAHLHYSFWYRDVQNNCNGGGFNFSNAWCVIWK